MVDEEKIDETVKQESAGTRPAQASHINHAGIIKESKNSIEGSQDFMQQIEGNGSDTKTDDIFLEDTSSIPFDKVICRAEDFNAVSNESQGSVSQSSVPPLQNLVNYRRRPGAIYVVGRGRAVPTSSNIDIRTEDGGHLDVEAAETPPAVQGYVVEQRARVTIPQQQPTVVQVNVEKVSSPSSKRTARLVFLMIGAIMICVAIGFSIFILHKGSEETELQQSTTTSPTESLASLDPYEVLQRLIGDGTLLNNRNSAQGEAFYWLTQLDPLGLVNESGIAPWRLEQRYTLAWLYYSTNGSAWANQYGFLSGVNECLWNERVPFLDPEENVSVDGVNNTDILAGIARCSTDGQIESIQLLRNRLSNVVPWDALAKLPSIRNLNFESNPGLVGTLPRELGQASRLQSLTLGGNQLNGTLPVEWAKLSELQILAVVGNGITGTIPSEYQALTDLTFLGLFNNALTGKFPYELGALGSSMRIAIFASNQFSGTLPPEYSNWTNIEFFNVANNRLSGQLPDSYNVWTRAETILFFDNLLSGTLPESYSSWTSANDISFSTNQFTGTLPESYEKWTRTQLFNSYENFLSGTIPDSYSAWTNLEVLGIYQNRLEGTISEKFGAWTMMKEAFFYSNQFSGTLPQTFSSWENLEYVDFSQNAFNGTLPEAYQAWTQTEGVLVFDNAFTGTLPESYSSWSSVREAGFNRNRFTGTLPDSYSAWTSARVIAFHENFLTGTLPQSYSAWTNVDWVRFYRNRFTGTLPEAYGAWTNLRRISLYENRLSGSLPDHYSSWTNLQQCRMYRNDLTGTFPSSYLESWVDIQEYDFTENELNATTELLLLPFYSEGYYELFCNICGDGNVMTLPNARMDLSPLGFSLNACRLVQELELAFPPDACPVLREIASNTCGCTAA